MKDTISRTFARYQRTFTEFTTGQKVVAVLGTAALLLAGFLVFRWAATPSYAPLFSNLSSKDAAAVIDKLDADGVSYKITNGGATVMVPKDQVYTSRIALSGAGLPSGSSEGGYSILDKQSLSTSQAQEQNNFKRAMEGELSKTLEALDGVQTAVVHLAIPKKQVFADSQDPATASVLIATRPGTTLSAEQVTSITNLVASSIDGLDPAKVTVTDSAGRMLSSGDGAAGTAASTRDQQVTDYQQQLNSRIQTMLDRVVGPGNSTVAVTANLDFDKSVTETKKYGYDKNNAPLSSTKSSEKYNGAGARSGLTGVVGPDGQMDSSGTANSGGNGVYEKSSETSDNAVDLTVERRENAPGSVRNLHVGVVLDAATARTIDSNVVQGLITSAVGINPARGDTVQVSTLPFDRTAEKAAKAELAAAAKADASSRQMSLLRNSGLVVLIALIVLLAWLKGRKRAKARAEATSYVVEQLRLDALERANAQPVETSAALLALESTEQSETEDMLDELAALVERQPEDVAALLRGWLVERP
ncbi:flagellar M-ring protein FliF [Nocardioides marmoriginsengisoli]|uniref:Flagellar M-ring protein n=1 Tax=Nocardioides marmoriginsengisoli TaxID=661483 RepID=A0A3N0CHA0_9ACTN|nr:flagellar basal-body MS-ring/collar protein FliF [Nocardioides marmoriginsengisoli]RNL62659.1 flagellar M-ring protein FliF [Nocardioides marmoriginsengisoli]